MPVAGDHSAKRPFNISQVNAGFNMIVFGNIFVVIKINKPIA
jgi:hypothetical protein